MITVLLSFLIDHGLMLLGGTTAFLAAGAIAAALQRSPLHRQRVGELTLLCTIIWLVTACLPLPRWNGIAAHQDVPRPATSLVDSRTHVPTPAAAPFHEVDRAELARLTAQLARTSDVDPQLVPVASEGPQLIIDKDPRPLRLGAALAAAYVIAVGVSLAWLCLGHLVLWRIVLTASQPQPWISQLIEDLAAQENIRAPRLLISSRCDRAFSCGLFRPTVVLGRSCAVLASPSQLRQILLHELAHVRQRDAWGNALFNFALPVLFFHPLYWHLRSRVSLARELIADDWAATRGGRSAYARDLLAFAKTRTTRGSVVGAVALFESTTHFYRRIHMLVQRDHALQTRCSYPWRLGTFAACGFALVVAGASLGLRSAAAQTVTAQATTETKEADDEVVTKSEDANDAESADQKSVAEAERAKLEKQLAEAQQRLADMERKFQSMQIQQADGRKLKEDAAKMADQMKMAEMQRMKAEQQAMMAVKAMEELGAMQGKPADFAAQREALEAERRALVDQKQGLKEAGSMMGAGGAKMAGQEMPHGGAGSHLDLVNLATSYADAVGAVNLAKAGLQRNGKPADRAVAEATLENAVRKAELLHRIAEVETDQANNDLQRVGQLAKMGAVPESEFREAQAKVRILQLILGSESGEKGNYNRNDNVKEGIERGR